ncbi:PRD domain-containing protein [Periweissella fabalis]|uniref:PRD domain-containing protein n=1 Tax=Periweissella fabalis TaxID=1070421 RepID=A0A7X6N1C7_9LACO|nr:PRD domain-containing protein [Periweissella fabalis]MCM0599160.1 PRD domain-containing protein [Periweissella fabalis]NKZ23439.1 PRD domain-containing protein [Periweissella fabalis]
MNILTKGEDNTDSVVKIVLCKEEKFNELYQNVLKSMANTLNVSILKLFDYAELLALSLRTTISILRLQNNFPIGSLQLMSIANDEQRAHIESLSTMKSFFDQYDIPLLKDEYEYIMDHAPQKLEQSDTLALAVDLVNEVSDKMNLPFNHDKELISNLFAHLSLRLSKKRIYTNEYNPFIDDILLKNRKLFNAIKEALEAKKANYSYLLNDSFVAYIVLHFLVSMEKQQKEVVQVIYVCSTGLGVTKFIEQRIAQEVTNIEIVDFVSVLNADAVIKAKKPDLVISIFPIDGATCPVIKVHAIPTVEDIESIKTTVHQLLDTGSAHIVKKLKLVIY